MNSNESHESLFAAALRRSRTMSTPQLLHEADVDAICLRLGVAWNVPEERLELVEAIQGALARERRERGFRRLCERAARRPQLIVELLRRHDQTRQLGERLGAALEEETRLAIRGVEELRRMMAG